MSLLRPALLFALVLALSACGGNGEERSAQDSLAAGSLATPAPAETTDIRDEPLAPGVFKDPRIETLTQTERRILRAYLAGVAQRHASDSMAARRTAPPESLARWLDTNLTVGEIINLNRGTEAVDPQPLQPLSQNERPSPPDRVQE